jgi:hypothetical protein
MLMPPLYKQGKKGQTERGREKERERERERERDIYQPSAYKVAVPAALAPSSSA